VPELAAPKTTSLHPAEILRCLGIKVWDVERREMVALKRV
jgi:omega-6 fatty acid desaturase (delta-12 desaturase)